MLIKGIVVEDFVNYKMPSMFISTSVCDFKCDRESGVSCCQNSSLASQPTIEVPDETIIKRYMRNPITKAIVFGGLEPFEQFPELMFFLDKLRNTYKCSDPVVIYTGFNKDEIGTSIATIRSSFQNIIVKYGRFIPNQEKHFDDILGVFLASPNQYAEVIC